MKLLKRILLALAIMAAVVSLTVYFYLHSKIPAYDGTVVLQGLKQEVQVKYDTFGIPHIYAGSEEDAFFALGYVHAQDRLFQMELLRRVGAGTLSEIFGDDMSEVDRLFRTLGINEAAKKSAAAFLSSDTAMFQKNAWAYLGGINAYLETGTTPVEFQILGIEKQKFTPEDIYRIIGYMSFNFAEALRSDPVFEKINSQWGSAYLQDIAKEYLPGALRIPIHQHDTSVTAIARGVAAIFDILPAPPFIGSNGWVLSGSRTASGKVLFANDTHIGYSQPSVWYEAHLEAPGYSFYGNFLAGVPFGVIGHSRFASWGLTMFENDDMDLFREQPNPDDTMQFRFMDQWEPANGRMETIKIKGSDPIQFFVKETRHGPIFNQALKGLEQIKDPLSLQWTFTKFPSKTLQATYTFSKATRMSQFKEAVSWIHAPGLNVMYGDMDGNIAWWTAAKMTRYAAGVDAKLFLDGSSGLHEAAYYPFSDNPHAENPPEGFVYSCNNQPDTIHGIFLRGYFYPDDRASRLNQLIIQNPAWTMETMKAVQTDVTSRIKPVVAKEFADVVQSTADYSEEQTAAKALSVLNNWDGRHEVNDVAPTVFYTMMSYLMSFAMEDELGTGDYEVFSSTWCMQATINQLPMRTHSPWWDNVTTEQVKEDRAMIFKLAFDSTIMYLKEELGDDVMSWHWGRVHTIGQSHPFGSKKPMDMLFNIGPMPVKGGLEVMNNVGFELRKGQSFRSTYGPAMRILLDFHDIENSLSVNPSGQSGNPMSKHYGDQFELYNTGNYRKQMMNKEEIEKTKTGLLLLKPAG